jgi:hypothetical protein
VAANPAAPCPGTTLLGIAKHYGARVTWAELSNGQGQASHRSSSVNSFGSEKRLHSGVPSPVSGLLKGQRFKQPEPTALEGK